MTPQPLVSVVICFYNEERFLDAAIRSVFNQTYSHWELILVDDGSVDKSANIAKLYAQQSDKITYAAHPAHANKGLSASRNLGISKTQGELVAFLDADDVWEPIKLQHQVMQLAQNPTASMLCEASLYWYSWGNSKKDDFVIQVGEGKDRLYEPPQLIEFLYPLGKGAAPCPSGIMIKKTALEKVDGFESHFTGHYQLYEDQAFLFKVYLTEHVFISSACHNKYRQREGSIVEKVTKEGNYNLVRLYFLNYALQYLAKSPNPSDKVRKLLLQALLPYKHPILYLISYTLPAKGKRLLRQLLTKLRITK